MSGRLRTFAVLCLLSIGSGATLCAQAPALQCIANSGIPPTVRSEGYTELTGDIILSCAGGTPTPLGNAIPKRDITVYLNTQVTSRLLNGNQSEVLLSIDEPTTSQTSASQTCAAAGDCTAIAAGPSPSANQNEFKAAFDSTTGLSCTPGTANCVLNPNVFQGTVSGNLVTFSGIPIDPPGTQSSRIYRITNVRANAATLPSGAGGTPGQIQGLVAAIGVPIVNPTQIVAFVQPSMTAAVRNAGNSGALTSPVVISSASLTKVASLRFSELFPTAFKRRTTPAQPGNLTDVTIAEQNTFGLIYNSESGYYNTRLGVTAGLADTGTRFKAVFNGVPAGVRLFVDAAYAGGQNTLAELTATETGSFSAVAATNGSAAEVSISGGAGTAVWEYLGNQPLAVENLDFGVYAMVSGNPPPATITLNASYAPFGAQVASNNAGPRFLDNSTAVNVMTTSSCSFSITTPSTLGLGVVGTSYGPLALGACGGTPGYTWSAPAGALPVGLSLSAAGVLSGTPFTIGTTSFDVTLADSNGQTVSKTFSLMVVLPLVFANTTLPNSKAGESYSATLSASGGVPPYTWSVPYPPLPGSLVLNTSTGVISGRPPMTSSSTFQITVTDSVGQVKTANVELTVLPSPGYLCMANAGVPPIIRSEGAAELVGDITLNCVYVNIPNGPTAAGAPIPTTDIQITLTDNSGIVPVPLAGRLLADPWTEALLFLDEPAKGKRFPCDTPGGICAAVGDGTGGTTYYGGGAVGTAGNNRNVFQGKKIGPNTLLFPGIPIDPPGMNGSRIIRITNIRVNANAAYPTQSPSPGQVAATITAIGPAPIVGPTQIVGFVQPSLAVSLRDAGGAGTLAPPTIEPCANPPLTRTATLRFAELFPTAFRRRVVPPPPYDLSDPTLASQDTLGLIYNSETGFYDSSLSNGAGAATRGNPALAGLADFGTRFKAVFRNVPAGVRLFVDASYASRTGTALVSNLVQLTASETGPFSAVPATNGSAAEVAIVNGTGVAIWESVGGNPLVTDNQDLGVYVMASGNPAPATVTINGSLAPTGAGTSAPQFADTSTPLNLLSTRACAMNITGPTTLGIGIAGVSYSPATLTASGGTPPYKWSAPAGSLPAGLTLSDAGALSGTPSAVGATTFAATVADGDGRTLAQTYSVTVVMPLSVLSYVLPATTGGAAYSSNFAAAGGVLPYTWTIAGGSFPFGLSLNSATGALTGIAPAAGNYNFVVRVADAIGEAITFSATLIVTPPPVSIQTPSTLPAGVAGTPYSFTLATVGGQAPFTWALIAGALPPGLTLNASGAITGTPSASGAYAFSAQVRDAAGTTDRANFTLKINPAPLTITTAGPLPAAYVGTPYSQAFTAAGGVPPYTWGISGVMSPGMSLSKAGVLGGTPATAGSYLFGVSLTDSTGAAIGVNFTLTVLPPALSITTSTLPAATVGSPYGASLAASGGMSPYRWSATGLADGLSLDSASGSLTGLVKSPGTSTIKATVTDAGGASATASLSLAASMPAAPATRFPDTPTAVDAAAQPGIRFSLDAPYPFPIQGKATLVFTPDSGPDDPAVQFSSGGRSVDFTIPAGQLAPVFTIPMWGFQTGTTAGRIDVIVTLQSLGAAISPAPPVWSTRIERGAPAITGAAAAWTADGLTVTVTGYATSRTLRAARFRIGDGAEITVPLDSAFAQWLADSDSPNHGGRFTLFQTFPDIDPAAASVTVVLVNAEGESSPVTLGIPH